VSGDIYDIPMIYLQIIVQRTTKNYGKSVYKSVYYITSYLIYLMIIKLRISWQMWQKFIYPFNLISLQTFKDKTLRTNTWEGFLCRKATQL